MNCAPTNMSPRTEKFLDYVTAVILGVVFAYLAVVYFS